MNRRMLLAALIGAAVLPAVTSAVAQTADDFPNRPIRIIVPQAAGSGIDLQARTLAQKMGDAMGQSIVVDNRPGANGLLGTDIVAKSPPDGYTILVVDRGALSVNPSLYAKLPYDPLKDFSYIGIATDGPYVLVANPSLGVKTLPELVSLEKAKPGTINYASYGVGSMRSVSQ